MLKVGNGGSILKHSYKQIRSPSFARSLSTLAVKPYYITTPIFYPSAVPHIGHLHSLVVADVFARWSTVLNPTRPVRFVTGTDEHGSKIQKAAREKGLEPLAFCDNLSVHFRALAAKANASVTRFSRTTEQQHHDAVQHLWSQLYARGYIYKGTYDGWYSISDECFYTDAEVAESPTSDKDGKTRHISIETRSEVQWMQEETYRFRLSAFARPLLEHFEANRSAIQPPQHHTDVVAMLSTGLDDLSVSRTQSRLNWGIPVPNDPSHTIYVWIDALTTYLSSVGYPWASTDGTCDSNGWPPDLQIIGKDILRFHAVYLPAMLLALELPLPKQLLAHAHWTVDQRKMSKSIGNVADPNEAIDEFGVDVVRWYLARVGGRFKDDVDWSRDELQKHARELSSLLGNLLLRITSKKIQARVTASNNSVESGATDNSHILHSLLAPLSRLPAIVEHDMEQLHIAYALDEIAAVLQEANRLMTQIEPWKASTPTHNVAELYNAVVECLRIVGILLQPFVPSTTVRLLDALGVRHDQRSFAFTSLGVGDPGSVESGVRLFENRRKEVARRC